MGEQIGMSQGELEELLKRKTRAFTEEDIDVKFGRKKGVVANGHANGHAKKG